MIILGVDPGTIRTGYAILKKSDTDCRPLHFGTILLKEKSPLPQRLQKIYEEILRVIREFQPAEIAIEDLFFAKNAKSALKLGHARGVIMLAAAQENLPVFEYPPASVKQTIAGFGQATKEQMQKMVKIHLKMKETIEENANDALAVAICHLQNRKFAALAKGSLDSARGGKI